MGFKLELKFIPELSLEFLFVMVWDPSWFCKGQHCWNPEEEGKAYIILLMSSVPDQAGLTQNDEMGKDDSQFLFCFCVC